MLGKLIGAVVGERVSRHVSGINGPGGALLGVGTAALLRRLGPLGMIAALAGGYFVKKHFDKQEQPASPAKHVRRPSAKS